MKRILAVCCVISATSTVSLLAQDIYITTSDIPTPTNPSGLVYNMVENGSTELLTVTITDATWGNGGPGVLEWDFYDDATYAALSDVIEIFNNANKQAVIQFGSDDEQGNLPAMQYAPNPANLADLPQTDGTPYDEFPNSGLPLALYQNGTQVTLFDFIAFSDTDPTAPGSVSDSLQLLQYPVVPEPGVCLLGGLGALILIFKSRKRV